MPCSSDRILLRSALAGLSAALAVILLAGDAWAGEFRYPEGRHGKGELKHINGVPTLIVAGTPEEIGEQTAALTMESVGPLLNYPREYLRRRRMEGLWPALARAAKSMEPQFPEAYRREIEAGLEVSGLDPDVLLLGNTLFDMKKIGGCSALLIEPQRSATG